MNQITLQAPHPLQVRWAPTPDITSHELAKLLPLLFMHGAVYESDLPTAPTLRRHLEIKEKS